MGLSPGNTRKRACQKRAVVRMKTYAAVAAVGWKASGRNIARRINMDGYTAAWHLKRLSRYDLFESLGNGVYAVPERNGMNWCERVCPLWRTGDTCSVGRTERPKTRAAAAKCINDAVKYAAVIVAVERISRWDERRAEEDLGMSAREAKKILKELESRGILKYGSGGWHEISYNGGKTRK